MVGLAAVHPCRPASWGSRECPELKNTAVAQGLGRADGRGVAMGCDERRRAVGGSGEGSARSGLGHIGRADRHFEMLRLLVDGLAGGDVVTRLSQLARNMVGRREIR